MAQIVGCLDGMSQACLALDMPIVSGNVSLYNESKATGGGSAILPTPAIGAVGLLDDWGKSATIAFKAEDQTILLLDYRQGLETWEPEVGQSLWLREVHDRQDGQPPRVDLNGERRVGEFVRAMIAAKRLSAVHDVSDGGMLVAIVEMALAGNIGALIDFDLEEAETDKATFFSERQGQYVVTVTEDWLKIAEEARAAGVSVIRLGATYGSALEFVDDGISYDSIEGMNIPLADLRAAHEGFFPALMGDDAALA
jgi:phosphoribosylformylglycinamidine synthase subunit PurL